MKSIRNSWIIIIVAITCWQCAADFSAAPDSVGGNTGIGGSLARFTIVGDFMYTVDMQMLRTFDLTQPYDPVLKHELAVSGGVETIFPLDNWLLLGTQNGMLIYRIKADGTPEFTSMYRHVVSCDPVVANFQYAYVTLRAAGCREAVAGAADLLEVISISDINNPVVVASYPMSEPYGLGLDGNTLFVCDGRQGVKIFDTTNPTNLRQIGQINGFTAFDVIPLNGLLLIIGPDNIYQYDYTDLTNIRKVSQMAIGA